MGFLNRPMGLIKGLGEKVKAMSKQNVSLDAINEDKENNLEHLNNGYSGGTWYQKQGQLRSGWINKMRRKKKAMRKSAHNSRIVNSGGKKS